MYSTSFLKFYLLSEKLVDGKEDTARKENNPFQFFRCSLYVQKTQSQPFCLIQKPLSLLKIIKYPKIV